MNSHDLIMQMRRLIAEYDQSSQVPIGSSSGYARQPVTTGPDSRVQWGGREKRIVTMVGLSMGEHEEVADASYKRQRIEFRQHADGFWRNVNPVYFPLAVGTYGADSIIIDGVDIEKKIMSRMAQPVICHGGVNGLGFAPDALSVSADVMKMATGADKPQPMSAAERSAAPRAEWTPGKLADDFERAMKANDTMRKHLEAHQKAVAENILELQRGGLAPDPVFMPPRQAAVDAHNEAAYGLYQQMCGSNSVARGQLDPAELRDERAEYFAKTYDRWDSLSVALKPEESLGFCDHCERISSQRRNQLISMGHSTSHLVELPNEQGYALPCKNCR